MEQLFVITARVFGLAPNVKQARSSDTEKEKQQVAVPGDELQCPPGGALAADSLFSFFVPENCHLVSFPFLTSLVLWCSSVNRGSTLLDAAPPRLLVVLLHLLLHNR